MKHVQTTCLKTSSIVLALFLSTSCVNNIQEEEDFPLTPGTIPIQISAQILLMQTRVANNEFETDDQIGLFVLPESKDLSDKRYVDNMRFTLKGGIFEPDEPVYYPSGDGKYDFTGYYPYQPNAIAPNQSNIQVSVSPEQHTNAGYSLSDFMVAKTTGVIPSNKSVNLTLEHKMCQVRVSIQLTEDEDINALKQNASIVFNNTFTRATYNFTNNTFSSLNTPQNILTNGEWIIDEATHKLTGKKALLIPQEIGNGKLTLRVQGKNYSLPFPNDMEIASGYSCELLLKFSSKTGINGIFPSIGEWQEGSKSEGTLEEDQDEGVILLTDFNFEQSNVYNITNASGIVLAEVCKEYLLGEEINAQAIVLYPIGSQDGTVLQLLNATGNVHGGTVSWNTETNSFIYTSGIAESITTLYADAEGNIVLTPPENRQSVSLQAAVLTDNKGTERFVYPTVKIGTQYWMRENLKTTKYNDGGAISLITNMAVSTAGYYLKEDNLFYNKAAVSKGTMAPSGWKIPNNGDCEKLKSYIKNNTAVLKMGSSWESSASSHTPSNLSGFSGKPVGFFNKVTNKNTSIYSFKNQFTVFWYAEGTLTNFTGGGFSLLYNNNEIRMIESNDYAGYSIRYLKE